MSEVELLDRYETMNQIVALYIKGQTVSTITKALGMKRADVLDYLEEYRQIAANDPEIQARAKETLHNFDMHTGDIIREMWSIIEGSADDKVKAGVLKNLADIDRARVETLQKAGLYDDAALGDEVAKVQEQAEQIKQLLKEVVTTYPMTKELILKGINRIFNESNSVDIPEGGKALDA